MRKATCCDTSYLFAFYGDNPHTSQAKRLGNRAGLLVTVTPLNAFEFSNAIRLAVFQRRLQTEVGTAMLAGLRADLASGVLLQPPCDLDAVLAEADRLSATYTLTKGCRAFDILHVAAALCLEADEFLSFDDKQRELARAERLAVNAPAGGTV